MLDDWLPNLGASEKLEQQNGSFNGDNHVKPWYFGEVYLQTHILRSASMNLPIDILRLFLMPLNSACWLVVQKGRWTCSQWKSDSPIWIWVMSQLWSMIFIDDVESIESSEEHQEIPAVLIQLAICASGRTRSWSICLRCTARLRREA